MGDVVNLRQARKSRKRNEDERRAEANRVSHGRTKTEKRLAQAERERFDAAIEGARRDPAPGEE